MNIVKIPAETGSQALPPSFATLLWHFNKALTTNVKAQLMERDAIYAQSLDYYCQL